MKSFLDDYPRAKDEVLKAAEVAGYLWQNGWAERNGGNITVNITASRAAYSSARAQAAACATWHDGRWTTVL